MTRKRLGTFGERGALVRLFLEERAGVKRYVVQWGPKGARKQESYAFDKRGKAEAEAFVKAFSEEAATRLKAPRLTARELWQAFEVAEAPQLRARTLKLYGDSWRSWEQFYGRDAIAEDLTVPQMHRFRTELDAQGLATATVQNRIRDVRLVYNFGERMELIARNRWHLFVHKIAKDKRTKPRAEYRADEFLKIWAALDPQRSGQWRAWVAVGLLGIYGNRQGEILALQWEWITDDLVVIPPEHVKTGEESVLSLFPLTRAILEIAKQWRTRLAYAGPYVLPIGQVDGRAHASRRPTYSIQSLTDHIHRAEGRARVPTIRWRAGHGFRRGLVGDLADETGDVMLALQAVGDKDVKMAKRYRVRRNDKISDAVERRANQLMPKGATEVQPLAKKERANRFGSPVTPATTEV